MGGRIVADSSVFIVGLRLDGEVLTVPGVEGELKDLRSKSMLQISGAIIQSPSSDALKRARSVAEKTGDIRVLSPADIEVLALALECGAAIATDDYALQNVALQAGLQVLPVAQPVIKRKVRRVQRCYACKSAFEGDACPDCGTPARKRNERRIR